MTPERWQQIERLVEAVLKHQLDDRGRFLDAECGSDGDLRRQVAVLLESYDQVETFMEAPAALDLVREQLSPQQLRRQLAGDLDNLVLQALRREPERRYSSVEQLMADLSRQYDDGLEQER